MLCFCCVLPSFLFSSFLPSFLSLHSFFQSFFLSLFILFSGSFSLRPFPVVILALLVAYLGFVPLSVVVMVVVVVVVVVAAAVVGFRVI